MATLFSQFMLNNFNPRTREGCDAVSLANVDKALQISIHAPVKGATGPRRLIAPHFRAGISIHAPVKGATRDLYLNIRRKSNFNPRTREGCDYLTAFPYTAHCKISIHAPVKGATYYYTCFSCQLFLISIHAPVKGATSMSCTAEPGLE